MEMQAADLILVRGTGWVSREIETVTHSIYSHVALATGREGQLIEAQGFRRVGYQDASAYTGQADIFRCVWLKGYQSERIVQHAEKHIGERYDYPLIAVELLRFTTGIVLPWKEFHSRICSTLAAGAYRAEKMDPCRRIAKPAPGDLAKSWMFQKVGEV